MRINATQPANASASMTEARLWPLFSHAEALEIAGLSAEALLTWHKRGLAPETPGREARQGNRRVYTTLDVIALALVKRLADAGCELRQAQAVAKPMLLRAANRIFAPAMPRPGAEYLMLSASSAPRLVPASALAQSIVKPQLEQVTVIDFGAFAGQVRARYFDVLELKQRMAIQRALARRSAESEQRKDKLLKLQRLLARAIAQRRPASRPAGTH